jgi:transcriptional regulator with XRE-family HTH domain
MAQLSGVMTADFSDFHFEIDKSITKLKGLEGATGHTNSAMGEFSEGLGTVDKTLNVLGIRLGPQIQALRELGSAAGKTASEIGLIGTAGLTVAAAVGGWQIGRMISDFVGLDEVIGNATASLLGFGDVAGQRAAAGLDVLNRAAQIAGRTVTNFDEAMQIIKKHNLEVAESFNTGAQRVEQWNREIAAHRDVMPQITAELKNHSSTVQQLATHYGISKEAIEHYTRTLDASTKAQKAWADEARPRYEAIRKAQEELTEASGGWQKTLATLTPTVTAATMAALNYGLSQDKVALALGVSQTQVAAVDRQMKLNLETMAATEPRLGTLDQWIKENVADTKAWNTEWRFTSEVIDSEVIPSLDAVTAKAQTVAAAVSAAVSAAPGVAAGMDQKSPGNAPVSVNTGNITYQGGFESVFAEFMRKNPSGGALGGAFTMTPQKDFLTWALSMGLATRAPTITNTFNLVDTQDGLARKVGGTIAEQIQRGSLVN